MFVDLRPSFLKTRHFSYTVLTKLFCCGHGIKFKERETFSGSAGSWSCGTLHALKIFFSFVIHRHTFVWLLSTRWVPAWTLLQKQTILIHLASTAQVCPGVRSTLEEPAREEAWFHCPWAPNNTGEEGICRWLFWETVPFQGARGSSQRANQHRSDKLLCLALI